MPRSPRSSAVSRMLAIALIAAVAIPLGVVASHQFADVPNDNPFHADIDALVDSGVTSGCGGGNYCPSANVTREQMAAFLNRLGALAPGKVPVVNAKTAQDADKLDGLDSTAFLQAGDLVHVYGPGSWTQQGAAANTTAYVTSTTYTVSVSGPGTAQLKLHPVVPALEQGVTYGLSAVEICIEASATAFLNNVVVEGMGLGAPGAPAWFVEDTSNRTATGCYTIAPAEPEFAPSVALLVIITVTDAVYARIGTTTFTWTPMPQP